MKQKHIANPRAATPPHYLPIIALTLIVTAIVFATEHRGVLTPLDLRAYDILTAIQYSRIASPRSGEVPSGPVYNVDFDDAPARQYNAFPIPRALLADVITKIASGKPSVIGLDVILDRPRENA